MSPEKGLTRVVFWLALRVLLYAPYHRQDNTYHGCQVNVLNTKHIRMKSGPQL